MADLTDEQIINAYRETVNAARAARAALAGRPRRSSSCNG